MYFHTQGFCNCQSVHLERSFPDVPTWPFPHLLQALTHMSALQPGLPQIPIFHSCLIFIHSFLHHLTNCMFYLLFWLAYSFSPHPAVPISSSQGFSSISQHLLYTRHIVVTELDKDHTCSGSWSNNDMSQQRGLQPCVW